VYRPQCRHADAGQLRQLDHRNDARIQLGH
jgi:hypothetical protein